MASVSYQKSVNKNHSAYCDNCEKLIFGTRFKCMYCENFDLCKKCESHCNHDVSHAVIKIKWPIHNKIYRSLFLPHHTNESMTLSKVSCDNCHKSLMYSVKYKCEHCKDFNLRDNCEPTYEHDPKHAFIKYTRPI
ncbi:hypothetical protein C2G38_1998633, partial [Gigaspora rosea]